MAEDEKRRVKQVLKTCPIKNEICHGVAMVVKYIDRTWEEVGSGDLYYCKMDPGEYKLLLIDVNSKSLKWQMQM